MYVRIFFMKKFIFLSLLFYLINITRLLSNEPIGGMYFSYYANKDEVAKIEFNIAEDNITNIKLYIQYNNRGPKEVNISCDSTDLSRREDFHSINITCNKADIRQYLIGDINLLKLKKRSEKGITANLKILRIAHKKSFYEQLDKNPSYNMEDHQIYIKEEIIRESKLKAEQEAKLKAEQEAKLKAEQEAKLKAEQEAKLKAEQEAKLRAELESKLKEELEAKIKAELEAKIKADIEAELKAKKQAKLDAELEAKLEVERQAKLKAEQEAKLKAEREAKIKAEREAKLKAEREAKLKAEQEAKLKAEQEAKLRAEELKNIPGFRNIKPGMTRGEILKEADCNIMRDTWVSCYNIDNLLFSGKLQKGYLTELYVDLGPIVDTYSIYRTFTEMMGEEPSNIYEKTLQSLNNKYSRNYSYNERERQLFNEKLINQLLVVFSSGKVALKIFRKQIDTYNTSLWLHVEYRNSKQGKLFLDSNRPTREKSDDF